MLARPVNVKLAAASGSIRFIIPWASKVVLASIFISENLFSIQNSKKKGKNECPR